MLVLPNLWSYAKNIKLCVSFAKSMELCQVLPKKNYVLVLPKIWNYISSFAKNISYVLVLPNLWSYPRFAKKIKLCLSFAKKMELNPKCKTDFFTKSDFYFIH